MTQFARWQATIVDDEGNILPAASVEVRNEATGSLVTLYADRLGASGKSNPFAADSEGFAFFHAAGGAYKITATKDAFSREWRYVAVGRGGEHDDLDGVSFGTLRQAVLDSPLATDADPGEGAITFDGASMASVTEIAISTKNTEASDEADYIDQLDDNAATIKTRLLIRNRLDPWVDWAIFELTGVTTPAESPTPDYRKLAVTYVDHGGSFEDGMILVIADSPTGEQGFVGSDGVDPGVLFNFDDGTSDADPGSGNIRANNAALGSATELYVSKTNRAGNNVATWLATLDDSTNVSKLGVIVLTRTSDESQATYDLDSIAEETAYYKLTVLNHSGATAFTDGQPLSLQFYPAGDKGDDGAGLVDSVQGQTGDVVLSAADIPFADSPAPFGAADVEEALEEAQTAATTSAAGRVELATTTEVLTGTDADRAVTPDSLAALWEKGSAVASSATISLGEGGYFHITGTTTITDIDFATAKDGRAAVLEFDGILTLTHNATTLKLPGGANIVTAAGDTCLVIQDSSDNVRVAWYQRAVALDDVLAYGVVPAGGVDSIDLALDVYPQYKTFKLFFHGAPESDNVDLFLRLSDDGGTSFEADAADYRWGYVHGNFADTVTPTGVGDVSDSEIPVATAVGNATNEACCSEITVYSAHANNYTRVNYSSQRTNTNGDSLGMNGGGHTNAAWVATDVQLIMSSGQIAAGSYYCLKGIP